MAGKCDIADYSDIENKVQNANEQNKAVFHWRTKALQIASLAIPSPGLYLDNKTGEPVIGASVKVENTGIDVITDQFGYYTLSVPRGRHTLSIQSIGMKDTKREIMVYGDGKFNIEMQTQIISLKRVVVSAEKVSNVRSTANGCAKDRY